MIELELTPKIQEWLSTDKDKRDLQAGAELLLRVTRNRILYNNITRNPKGRAALLEYHLQKILKNRLIDTTHEEVRQMMAQVDAIADKRGFVPSSRTPFQNGKRSDHDELPDEIRQLYVDNADIMRSMREAHTRLRMINPQNSTCPDSDRYPLAKAIIEYDRQYRDNWNIYDHYVKGTPMAATVKAIDERTSQKNLVKTINLLIGKYVKNPSDAAADRIRSIWEQIEAPSDAVRKKMEDAKLFLN